VIQFRCYFIVKIFSEIRKGYTCISGFLTQNLPKFARLSRKINREKDTQFKFYSNNRHIFRKRKMIEIAIMQAIYLESVSLSGSFLSYMLSNWRYSQSFYFSQYKGNK